MSPLSDHLAALDRLVHDPARLSILTALASCQSADFTFLQRLTQLTGGNLSSHLIKLEEAGLVEMEKTFKDRRPNTRISITVRGRQAVQKHWQQLDDLRREAQGVQPDEPPSGLE